MLKGNCGERWWISWHVAKIYLVCSQSMLWGLFYQQPVGKPKANEINFAKRFFNFNISAYFRRLNQLSELAALFSRLDWKRSSGWLESWEGLFLGLTFRQPVQKSSSKSRLNSEDDFCTGWRNVSRKQQSFSGIQSPRWWFSVKVTSLLGSNHFIIVYSLNSETIIIKRLLLMLWQEGYQQLACS